MKLVTEYLEQAVHFERMAEQEADEELKAKRLEQANAYFNLAEKQARELGLPPPQRPARSDWAERLAKHRGVARHPRTRLMRRSGQRGTRAGVRPEPFGHDL